MRTLFDTEEEEIEGKASEITLSTASLLGIFFGLVLVCGVFFGFGYSTGRGTGAAQATLSPRSSMGNIGEADEAAAVTPPAPAPTAQQQNHSQSNAKAAPAPVVTQPQAGETPGEEPTGSEHAAEPPAHGDVVGASVKPVDAARATISKPSPQKSTVLVAATGARNMSAAPVSGQPMVQIAAVARPEDANVLVSALRKRGYGAIVRDDPQDKLLHVQIGPFSDRVQAAEIRQKLLSDGYNAIIKQ